MIATHTAMFHAKCPVDGRWDYYTVEVTCTDTIVVEAIEDILDALRGCERYQEDITREIKARLPSHATVKTTGVHGKGTSTVVTA